MSLLLRVENLSKYFTDEPVLDGVSFDIRTGQRVCLVGPNGCGKTTLVSIICGAVTPNSGSVERAPRTSIGWLQQAPQLDTDATVWDIGRSGMQPLVDLNREAQAISEQMAAKPDQAANERLTKRFDQIHLRLQQRGGYNFEHKIERVLTGLGFSEPEFQQPARLLSGGQVNRLLLAKLLLEEPDLMILDEPSNHLDIQATEWLESFLLESRQAFLLISHDRFFLDRVANRTLELINGTIDDYPGNYSKYHLLKQQRLDVERRTYTKQQEEIEKLKDFIRRHHHGQKHAQAEDRRKKLERIELVPAPREIAPPSMRFPDAARAGDIVLRVEKAAKSFDQPLFRNVTFQIERGQRWGIVGGNGCGKTTLLRCLLRLEHLDQGQFQLGQGVQVGYFDQQLQSVPDELEAAEAVRPAAENLDNQQRRNLLARFGIRGEQAFQKIASLSGGQRTRVALAKLAAEDANFLILDEPTNHLDLWSREALEQALKNYTGTILVVSHDRFFINQICDHLLVMEGSTHTVIPGNYQTYLHMRSLKDQQSPTADRKQQPRPVSRPTTKRRRKFPYRKIHELESEIAETEQRIKSIYQDLSNPEFLKQGERVVSANQQLEELQTKLEQLYEHWEEAAELN